MTKRETSHRERIEMVEMKERGMSLAQIAADKGLHRDTVKKWWRVYREQGWEGLCPKAPGRARAGPLSRFDPMVRYVALRLKCEHPKWGPDVLLLEMSRRASLSGKALPGRSTLAAYLKPYLPRLNGERPTVRCRATSKPWRISQVHECWEMDFKGDETVGNCGAVAPLIVTDALTSAPLGEIILPASRAGLTFRRIQAALRPIFAQWGLPDAIRTDRDTVFVGSTRLEWPGTLLLWFVGLGILPIINDPGRPTQNAHVERGGLTWKNRVAVGASFETLDEVQAYSDQTRFDRLTLLPSRNGACAGRPPMLAHPELATPRRTFDPTHEVNLFDFEGVELYLADWVGLRKVDKVGYISLADHRVSVGRAYAGQTVKVLYDLDRHAFAAYAYDDSHSLLNTFALDVISPDYIMGLE
jgi:transposase-like protein